MFYPDHVKCSMDLLNAFEDTDLGGELELDVINIIVDYVVDKRGPELLRSKIFELARESPHGSVFLMGVRLDQTTSELTAMSFADIVPFIYRPTTDGSRMFGLHAKRKPGSFNIKMIMLAFPIRADYNAVSWEETSSSLWRMFIGVDVPDAKISFDTCNIEFKRVAKLLSSTPLGQRMLRSLVADDAAELARARMATGRIAILPRDVISTVTLPDDVDMFISRDELNRKDAARLSEIRIMFPDCIARMIDDYVIDQTHVAADMMTISLRPEILESVSFPDPEDPQGCWYVAIDGYQPKSISIRGMRNSMYSGWDIVNIPDVIGFIAGDTNQSLTQTIIEARTFYIDHREAPNWIKFDQMLINAIVDGMRDAVRAALNTKMNRDMRHMMRDN